MSHHPLPPSGHHSGATPAPASGNHAARQAAGHASGTHKSAGAVGGCTSRSAQGGHAALFDLKKGQRARVHSIHAAGELGRRLRDMGLLPGVELMVTGRAPLGCPLSISLDGYDLSLRCEEAKLVWVDSADEASATSIKE